MCIAASAAVPSDLERAQRGIPDWSKHGTNRLLVTPAGAYGIWDRTALVESAIDASCRETARHGGACGKRELNYSAGGRARETRMYK